MRTYSAREWAERLTMRVSPADIERLGRTMLVTIDRVSSSRWEAAVGRAAALGGDVDHGHEQAEEDRCRAQVRLERHDCQRQQPGTQQRSQVAAAR